MYKFCTFSPGVESRSLKIRLWGFEYFEKTKKKFSSVRRFFAKKLNLLVHLIFNLFDKDNYECFDKCFALQEKSNSSRQRRKTEEKEGQLRHS